jgi:hypothetical protein
VKIGVKMFDLDVAISTAALSSVETLFIRQV